MRSNLCIICLGQMDQLMAKHLVPHGTVVVTDCVDKSAEATAVNVTFTTLEQVAKAENVIVGVPVAVLEETLKQLAPLVGPHTLVLDVASVKVKPAGWLQTYMPPHVDILATHPLLGPQSAKNGLTGLRFVLCPLRGTVHEKVAAFGKKLGLQVHVVTPDEHDREMAYVHALTHLIGRTLATMKVPDEHLKTKSYQHLLELCDLIKDDTFQLFKAIQTDNPYASEITATFMATAHSLLVKSSTK